MIGAMRERLVLQSPDPVALGVTSLTQAAGLATATTAKPHGLSTGEYATVAGATPTAYNGRVKVTVTGLTGFTYAVAAATASPATGTITAVYASDALGGAKKAWTSVDTVPAELVPIRASERLQAAAIQAQVEYRFRTWIRADLTARWRLLWTPTQPAGAPQHILQINGVLPQGDGRRWMTIDCGEFRA